MTTSTEIKQGADRILAKLVKMESKQLRDGLAAGDYALVRRCASQLAKTLRIINREMEARAK